MHKKAVIGHQQGSGRSTALHPRAPAGRLAVLQSSMVQDLFIPRQPTRAPAASSSLASCACTVFSWEVECIFLPATILAALQMHARHQAAFRLGLPTRATIWQALQDPPVHAGMRAGVLCHTRSPHAGERAAAPARGLGGPHAAEQLGSCQGHLPTAQPGQAHLLQGAGGPRRCGSGRSHRVGCQLLLTSCSSPCTPAMHLPGGYTAVRVSWSAQAGPRSCQRPVLVL